MQLFAPFALALFVLAIPIVLLYMLKLRREQTTVSSIMLWERLLRDKQANAPWQKLKRNLLLLLQLLILAALVSALARPALRTKVVAAGQAVVLLDASASMNATDVAPNRFEWAKESALALIDGLTDDSSMTLILVGRIPRTLISSATDKNALKAALKEAQPTQGAADWNAAFALAAGALRGNQNASVVIVSDGGLPDSGLPPLPAQARYILVGESNDNLALSAFATRESNGAPQLFAEVRNYGEKNRVCIFSLYADERLLLARRVEVAPGSRASLTLEDLPAADIYKARIYNPEASLPLDALALDDVAYAVYQPLAARRALLVSKGNVFLEQLLASLPGLRSFRALPAADGSLQLPAEPFDLYVFDGDLPQSLPEANLLLVNPSSNALFEVGETFAVESALVRESSLTRYVDWKDIHVLRARKVVLPNWMTVLVEADSNPLVFAGERNGWRVAGVAFDLRESDLPLQTAYPILFSNLVEYLAPPAAFDSSQALRPGESLFFSPPMDARQIVVASPSNQLFRLAPGQTVFSQTDELGYYAVNFLAEDASRAEYFAVNLFDPLESNIAPQEMLRLFGQIIPAAAPNQTAWRELRSWLAGFALLALTAEWQLFHRRKISWKRSE